MSRSIQSASEQMYERSPWWFRRVLERVREGSIDEFRSIKTASNSSPISRQLLSS